MLYIEKENKNKTQKETIESILDYYISDIDYIVELDSTDEEYYNELREYIKKIKNSL